MIKQKVWQAKIKLSCLLALNYHRAWMLLVFFPTARQQKAADRLLWREDNTSWCTDASPTNTGRDEGGGGTFAGANLKTFFSPGHNFTLSLYLQNQIIISIHLHKPISCFPFNVFLFCLWLILPVLKFSSSGSRSLPLISPRRLNKVST